MRKGQKPMLIPGSSTSGFSVPLCGVLNMRTFPTVKEERNIVKSVTIYIEENYIFPFLTRLCDKKKCLKKKKNVQRYFLPLPRFPRLCLEGLLEGTRKTDNLRKPGLGKPGGWGKTWKPKDSRVALATFAVWGDALS